MKLKLLSMLGVAVSLLWALPSAQADKRPNAYNTPQQRQEFERRQQQFLRLWRSRRQRNVVRPLLEMLKNERTPHLRTQIVVALGRMEDGQAAPALNTLLAQTSRTKTWRNQIPVYQIQIALGRIRSHKLRGERKLNVIAQSVSSTWPGIKQMAARLRKQLSNAKTRLAATDNNEFAIVGEFQDVLYRMGKRGENIQQLGASGLSLRPQAQPQPLLEAAKLSDKDEIRYWLNAAMPPNKIRFNPAHLLDLGPTVSSELMKYLKIYLAKAKAKPTVMASGRGYRSMFKAAAATGDNRFLPILKEFTKVDDRWARIYAEQAIEELQRLNAR